MRPAAYEVRGEVVARPRPDLLLIRHEPIGALGMGAMELMAVSAAPALLDPLGLEPGEPVRLAVRREGDALVLVWIERLRPTYRAPGAGSPSRRTEATSASMSASLRW